MYMTLQLKVYTLFVPQKAKTKKACVFRKSFQGALLLHAVLSDKGAYQRIYTELALYLPRIYLMECIPFSMVRGKILSSQCQYLL